VSVSSRCNCPSRLGALIVAARGASLQTLVT
jgi:hypothetical protein